MICNITLYYIVARPSLASSNRGVPKRGSQVPESVNINSMITKNTEIKISKLNIQ